MKYIKQYESFEKSVNPIVELINHMITNTSILDIYPEDADEDSEEYFEESDDILWIWDEEDLIDTILEIIDIMIGVVDFDIDNATKYLNQLIFNINIQEIKSFVGAPDEKETLIVANKIFDYFEKMEPDILNKYEMNQKITKYNL